MKELKKGCMCGVCVSMYKRKKRACVYPWSAHEWSVCVCVPTFVRVCRWKQNAPDFSFGPFGIVLPWKFQWSLWLPFMLKLDNLSAQCWWKIDPICLAEQWHGWEGATHKCFVYIASSFKLELSICIRWFLGWQIFDAGGGFINLYRFVTLKKYKW